ncbi:MAG: 2-oxoacid:acceptor oxidoreductase family protein [Conexivisphaerales archaeon]
MILMIVRVRFHGRGGQGAKTASRILGTACFVEGMNVQDSPVYGAERRGAPVTAFTRISDSEILERGYVFDPDLLIVMDATLLASPVAKVTDGIRKKGVIFLNAQSANVIGEHYTLPSDVRIANYDLTSSAMEMLGKPIISSASAAAAARLVGLVKESSLEQAIETELEEIGLSEEMIKKNVMLGRKIFSSLEPLELATEESEKKLRIVPLEMITSNDGLEDIIAVGNSKVAKTGSWRIFKPVVDYEKCTACTVCYAYCPESALILRQDGKPEIDYDNCKGCLICYRECPPKAINIEREVIAF